MATISADELMRHYALVINRDGDAARLALMRRAFEREGVPMPRRVGGMEFRHVGHSRWWHTRDNRFYALNCAASHAMCVRMAEAFCWPCVAVFEDDAWPRRGAMEAIDAALEARPEGCGALMLGTSRRLAPTVPVGSGVLARCGDFRGSHAYVLFREAFATYLSAFRTELRGYEADMVFRHHAPLAAATLVVAKPVFCQANETADGRWKYTHTVQNETTGTAWWKVPDDGFPSAAEVFSEKEDEHD